MSTGEENYANGCKAVSGKTLYSALYGTYTGTLNELEASPKEVDTRNFFAPLRTTDMDMDFASTDTSPRETTTTAKTGRRPPIVLTSAVNLIQLQKQLKKVVKGDFEFRNTRNGTRIITIGMVDFLALISHFERNNLSYFTYPKSDKPIKAVIRHLPHKTPADDICDALVSLGCDIISVKKMTTTRQSPPEKSK
jgi:hypothetical protein